MVKYSFLKTFFCFSSVFLFASNLISQTQIPFFNGHKNQTATYEQIISYWQEVAQHTNQIQINSYGNTDSGHPLHLVTLQPLDEVQSNLLINNNIHPGEPDGIEATILLVENYLSGKNEFPKHTQIHFIVAYNVGGMLNRNATTRANQNGPEEYGFRGNAKNYDLNRDFIKADTKNSFSFFELFHQIDPDIFIDNHVSNGADYQYTLTYLFSQHNKLGGPLAEYQENKVIPEITQNLSDKGIPSTPYVNVFNAPPNNGFAQFLDTPRYSSGFTSLWNNISFLIETHMLKDYVNRVQVTYETMLESVQFLEENHQDLKEKRKEQNNYWQQQTHYPVHWKLDSTKTTPYNFKGFAYSYQKSELTGQERLIYHSDQPNEFELNYYNHYKAIKEVRIPQFYVIPKAWNEVVERLNANGIETQQIQSDSLIEVAAVKIETYESLTSPYEGHYLHYNTTTSEKNKRIQFQKGDLLVPVHQKGIRYILETLEPEATDSFFNWNFFDTILQRKEGFSPYVFEEKAIKFLNAHPKIKEEFEALKKADKDFAKNHYTQLNWIYEKSGIQEEAYLHYPIFKVY